MKTLLTFCSCLLLAIPVFAQLQVGSTLPDLKYQPVTANSNELADSVSLSDYKDKVILIEFWATWCPPCIRAMPRLDSLQKSFGDKLMILQVSNEQPSRISAFIKSKPFTLRYASDQAERLSNQFPFASLPHAILIKNGKVLAITSSENITNNAVTDLLNGKAINLPLKADIIVKDPVEAYFAAGTGIVERFLAQPQIKGINGSSYTYNYSEYANRRLTLINMSLNAMARIAHNNISYLRVKDDRILKKGPAEKYCIDIIVPQGKEDELYLRLQKELQDRFGLSLGLEKRLTPVWILKVADSSKINNYLTRNLQQRFSARGGVFSGDAIPLSKISYYLENFGITNIPVIDETGRNEKFDINFSFQPEKEEDYLAAIQALGLKLEKSERIIEMLVIK